MIVKMQQIRIWVPSKHSVLASYLMKQIITIVGGGTNFQRQEGWWINGKGIRTREAIDIWEFIVPSGGKHKEVEDTLDKLVKVLHDAGEESVLITHTSIDRVEFK